ncbi:LPXTG cell wall anchor domain-containing protein [Clostridium algidicarnis]|uniref:LPXTG cell wall anchor domain-containing protein n=1 Tax=Clostridium algidicarnis TaxID=37659 RepID=UPI001C0C39E2|nr:LPXTG cell wall anchor domain-containing protein [Clostridium algidicarnis]MBU3194859.1 LPXTG cell wall anchor domain-containing protein [Clostridium algidicarnis]
MKKIKSFFKQKASQTIAFILSFLMLFTILPPSIAPLAAEEDTGIFAIKFGYAQVFDCFRDSRSITLPVNVSGFTQPYVAPYTSYVRVNFGTNNDRYIKVCKTSTNGRYDLKLYEANGTFVQNVSNYGIISHLLTNNSGFLYVDGSSDTGYYFGINKGYSYGGSDSLNPNPKGNATDDDLKNINGSSEILQPWDKLDKGNPELVLTQDVTDWTKGSVTINVSATDSETGVNEIKKPDGTIVSGTSTSYVVSSNGTYTFEVTDNAGNKTTKSITVSNIDKTAPTYTSITSTPTTWTNNSVILTVNGAADNGGSGLNSSAYSFSTKQGVYNWQASNVSSSFSGNQLVYIYVRDDADNISSYSTVNIGNIDKDIPGITLTQDIASWTSSNVTINVSATDSLSGVKEIKKTDGTIVSGTSTSYVASSNGIYTFEVTDNAGNKTNKSITVSNIDKTAPIISSVIGNPSDWTNSDVTLTVNASDALSGLAAVAYSFDGGSTWQTQNTKTYAENTSNIVVKVKDVAGNIVIYNPINITKIDKTAPNTVVIADSAKYTDSNWYNETQTIKAGFTATAGCEEKLQHKVNDGAWTNGELISINDEGKYDVSFRVIDSLGRTSAPQNIKVNIDKSAPINAKITVKDRDFTSFLNTITFGIFFKETVDVSITADGNISGIKNIEYQKVEKDTEYNPDGTWTIGSSFNVAPDDEFVVYARITDNAGNYVVINSDGVIVDSTSPELALTPDVTDWTNGEVNVKVEASDKLAGVKEVTYTTNETVPETGTVAISDGVGTIKLNKEGQYELTVTANDNSLNGFSQTANIKIDKTIPKLTGATEASSYFIGRVIKLADNFGEITDATYKKDGANEIPFKNETLLDKTGKYNLTLKDKAGNSTELAFEIKPLPKVEDIIYTTDCKALIESIRAEFNSHSDLPKPYKTSTDNAIKDLEARYVKLHKEVMDIKAETSIINGKIDVLSKGIDGLISFKKEIQDEYNKIADDTSTLTKEQKLALEKEAEYLKQQLDIIAVLQNQIDSIDIRVSNMDTKVDYLISKEGKVKELLRDIDKLTKEQQHILQTQIDILNSLVDKINVLKEEVEAVKDMINKLPSAEKITRGNLELLTNANNLYNKLTNEQKKLVGEYLVKWLNDCLDALSKLMLHDENTDLTVTGIDGTIFDSDVYLVVTPFKFDNTDTKFTSTAERVKKAANTISEIKDKELVALYDISLFKDNVKIELNGKVKVKIKVPENLIGRSGLDIVHISDDSRVTPMHAVLEDGYLVFVTTHFSDYGIVANPIEKTIPKTGSVIDSNLLVVGGVLLILGGLVIIRRKQR